MIIRNVTQRGRNQGVVMSLKEYQEKMEAQLKDWGARLEEWKAKGAKATADAKVEMNRQIEAMRPKIEAAQEKLKELKAARGPAAEKLKEGSEKAMAELKKAWETVKSKFEKSGGGPVN
jgi:predicted nuclease with TOPRIM domain